jgi:hypothetical protein
MIEGMNVYGRVEQAEYVTLSILNTSAPPWPRFMLPSHPLRLRTMSQVRK